MTFSQFGKNFQSYFFIFFSFLKIGIFFFFFFFFEDRDFFFFEIGMFIQSTHTDPT